MKGHVRIELKNEKNGRVDVHEQDNMVTSAVAKVLGLAANLSASPSANSYNNFLYALLPIAEKALGGLFLFDGKLKEDINNIHFPMDVHLTGSAGRTSNTSSKLTGSLNEAESGLTDHGYVNTWDFSTSQANGVIGSLALTHQQGGVDPIWNMSLGLLSMQYSMIAYDSIKGIAYFNANGKIYSKKMNTEIIRIDSSNWGNNEEVFDFNFTNPDYHYWDVQNGYDGYLYAINMPYSSTPKTVSVRIIKVKISDFSFQKEEVTVSIDNLAPKGTTWDSSRSSTCLRCAISNGYLYIIRYGEQALYKVNLSNVADIKEIVFEDCKLKYMYPLYSGGIFAQFYWDEETASEGRKTREGFGIVYPDGKYLRSDKYYTSSGALSNYSYTGAEGNNLYTGRGSSIGYATNYLGTICNLTSPVVKTSEQSMKITYTLTDV